MNWFWSVQQRSVRYVSGMARRNKFYKTATVRREPIAVASDENKNNEYYYNIYLDGRLLKTPRGNQLNVNSEALALLIANEWNTQKNVLDINCMRLCGLQFTAIDNPLNVQREEIITKLLQYVQTDTILYRCDDNQKLNLLQTAAWDPILHWANDEFGLCLRPSWDLTHVPSQSAASLKCLRRYLESLKFECLIGMDYGVESVKSILIFLYSMLKRYDCREMVEVALLEQSFQSSIWGKVEWAHDIEIEESLSRLSAAILFTTLTSNVYLLSEVEDFKKI